MQTAGLSIESSKPPSLLTRLGSSATLRDVSVDSYFTKSGPPPRFSNSSPGSSETRRRLPLSLSTPSAAFSAPGMQVPESVIVARLMQVPESVNTNLLMQVPAFCNRRCRCQGPSSSLVSRCTAQASFSELWLTAPPRDAGDSLLRTPRDAGDSLLRTDAGESLLRSPRFATLLPTRTLSTRRPFGSHFLASCLLAHLPHPYETLGPFASPSPRRESWEFWLAASPIRAYWLTTIMASCRSAPCLRASPLAKPQRICVIGLITRLRNSHGPQGCAGALSFVPPLSLSSDPLRHLRAV